MMGKCFRKEQMCTTVIDLPQLVGMGGCPKVITCGRDLECGGFMLTFTTPLVWPHGKDGVKCKLTYITIIYTSLIIVMVGGSKLDCNTVFQFSFIVFCGKRGKLMITIKFDCSLW